MTKFNKCLFYSDNTNCLGTIRHYKFENGFGAATLEYFDSTKNKIMYEIAVLEFEENGFYKITYKTPVTADVVKVERKKLDDILTQIAELPKRKRVEIKKKTDGRVKIYLFKFIIAECKAVFEIRKFKNGMYKIASYGAYKDIEKYFVDFKEVKEFFRVIKNYKKEF